jgi:hypothetical protein
MNSPPDRPKLRIDSPASLLAAIPHILGFTPETSLVVLGVAPPGIAQVALRIDLPDPPDHGEAARIAAHVCGVLSRHQLSLAIVIGYGPGRLVTPVADAMRRDLPATGLRLQEVLRVQEGRYWSYLCQEPSCCPTDGVAFDAGNHPAAKALAAAGLEALPSRAALAATIAPVTGDEARIMAAATRRAETLATRLITRSGPAGLNLPGLLAVRKAIETYRDGGQFRPTRHAFLALALTQLRIRDDAWARMDPAHCAAHRRLWTDVTRCAQPGYVAAPASLLAIAAWQQGNGALASIAVERALADDHQYSMALLIRDAFSAGAPPSIAVPPMTPDEVTASYANQTRTPPGGSTPDGSS